MFKLKPVEPSEPILPEKTKFQIDLDLYCTKNDLHYVYTVDIHSKTISVMFEKINHCVMLKFNQIDFLNVKQYSYPIELLDYIKERTNELCKKK